MQTLKKGSVSSSWPREKSCGHCTAVISFEKSDLFKLDDGKIAFLCPECGRVQPIKDILHTSDENMLPKKEDFLRLSEPKTDVPEQ